MSRALIQSLVSVLVLSVAGCGGGGGGGGGGGPGITGVVPNSISSESQATVTVQGSGFGAPGSATVRLTAATGTPFTGGTAAFIDVSGLVISDTTVTFTAPAAQITSGTSFASSVRVTLPSLVVYDSAGPILTFVRPTFVAFTPDEVSTTTPTPFTISGTGFGPPSGTALVTFTAASGTPFAGGTSATATVTGTVASTTTITGTTPVATTGTDFAASVLVTFTGGSTAGSTGPATTFVVNFSPSIATSLPSTDLNLAHGDRVSITITVTDPESNLVTLRLLNPPPGATFPGVTTPTAPPFSRTLEWVVDGLNDAGAVPLVFRASDPGKTRDRIVWLHLTPGIARTMLVGDVTGDGIADTVVVAHKADVGATLDAGAIYVWAGGLIPSGTPVATLVVSGASAGDQLGSGGFRLADVSGDGVLDVVAASPKADAGIFADQGAIYMWRGGATLTGVVSPFATMPGGGVTGGNDLAVDPLHWQIGDVSGDAIPDIVACASKFNANVGELLMWKGGATLTGVKSPDATLAVTGAVPGDQVGADGLQLKELTGDTVLDVFSSSSTVASNTGALYLWKGGATLTGLVAPTATMTVTGSTPLNLGLGAGSAIPLVDVTNDGTADVVAPVPGATVATVPGAGGIYVWKGGATLTGAKTQDATLLSASAQPADGLGAGPATRLLVGDVSGDGTPDVVGVAYQADFTVFDQGVIYMWKGGATLTGFKAQDALLRVAVPTAVDSLGSGGTRLADVTNDGVLDVVSAAPLADVGTANTGAVYVWAGGAGLTGTVSPTSSLSAPGANADDRLSNDWVRGTFTSRFADVTGDKALDLLIPAVQSDASGTDSGALFVWAGGAALTSAPAPRATLLQPGAQPGDKLGLSSGAFVTAGDLNGDGTLDVVTAAAFADVAPRVDAGSLYVWNGGAGLVGFPAASATMRLAGAFDVDQLGGGTALGVNWDLAEVTGDSIRDVIAAAPLADTATLVDSGAGYLWEGGAALAGVVPPKATFFAPNRDNIDALGRSGTGTSAFDLLLAADVTGEGIADLLIGASDYTGIGATARGGVFLWKGGLLTGTPVPTSSFLVAGASAQDRLGN